MKFDILDFYQNVRHVANVERREFCTKAKICPCVLLKVAQYIFIGIKICFKEKW